MSSIERRHPHCANPDADAFSRNHLVETLGVSHNGNAIARNLGPFFEFPHGNRGYSSKQRRCKPYRLRPDVLEAVSSVISGDALLPVRWRTKGDETLPAGEIPPSNGIPSALSDRLTLPSIIPLDMERVNRCLVRLSEWSIASELHAPFDSNKPNGARMKDVWRKLNVIRQWVQSAGGLPNCYTEYCHGRLGPLGFHLIELPNKLRHFLFEGSDLVDYDLRSCHYSLFISLGKAYHYETTFAEQYLEEKDVVHEHWSGLTGCRDLGAFKSLTASFLTGGSLSASPHTQSGEVLGPAVMKLLGEDDFALALFREARQGMEALFRAHRGKDGRDHVLVNVLGKELVLEGSSRDFGRACSHLLTGYEQFVIRTMCAGMTGLTAIIYDGFIATEQDTEGLEGLVRETSLRELGVSLDVSLKASRYADPVPGPYVDPRDF